MCNTKRGVLYFKSYALAFDGASKGRTSPTPGPREQRTHEQSELSVTTESPCPGPRGAGVDRAGSRHQRTEQVRGAAGRRALRRQFALGGGGNSAGTRLVFGGRPTAPPPCSAARFRSCFLPLGGTPGMKPVGVPAPQ